VVISCGRPGGRILPCVARLGLTMTGPWVAESILEFELEWTTSFPSTGRWPVRDVRMWLIPPRQAV
jgi:hypothetical protein